MNPHRKMRIFLLAVNHLMFLSIGSGFSPILIKESTSALAKTYFRKLTIKIFDFCVWINC